MSVLNRLINLLVSKLDGISPADILQIQNFSRDHKIFLRDDHLQFLVKFGRQSGERLQIFKNYGGDFDFDMLQHIYIQGDHEFELPEGFTFFGVTFNGESFCINDESGKIYAYEEGEIYGLVHESINGFLLNCLLSDSCGKFFSSTKNSKDLNVNFINEFRLVNEKNRIHEATLFEGRPENLIVSEYYIIGEKLIFLFLDAQTMTTFSGGVMNKLYNY